ncbi:hypothetical protein Pst134EA_000283 [Puccinia striiformis f. sp. tritici]|uniref:hypothetical protein n=1 Tax=Puccinia striiformis f. sp. tritici TaxID=168172 RepID=UPI002008EAE0|nr:hypothetical protein Pst134EA_000283 [Puccinia striiformis f. sp. tritici]KAH9473208.1 hypothetical protein Pst134EA_000283 [Puccinia striiformis f. sp. tritici]
MYADRSSIFFTYLPGIVDDAQSKAKQLKSKSKEGLEGAKATISSEADALKNKVATAAGVGATPKASSTRPSTIECSR